jgi:signal transduction histidine kinase
LEAELAKDSEKLEKIVKERSEQLKQTQAKLVKSERLAAIGELAAMIGHDLRNPLTGIKTATYYIKTKTNTENDDKTRQMLETIDDCIIQSNKIISDLLEYSIEMKLELNQTNIKKIVNYSLSTLTIPNDIQINQEIENGLESKVDEAKINRVFINILKNSFDAMPNGGILTIKTALHENNLSIVFTDTGIGMSNETLSKLGAPLFTTKAKGMGFGLPICKRIVEAHGGKVDVESRLGKGTTIKITISVDPKPKLQEEPTLFFPETVESTAK